MSFDFSTCQRPLTSKDSAGPVCENVSQSQRKKAKLNRLYKHLDGLSLNGSENICKLIDLVVPRTACHLFDILLQSAYAKDIVKINKKEINHH